MVIIVVIVGSGSSNEALLTADAAEAIPPDSVGFNVSVLSRKGARGLFVVAWRVGGSWFSSLSAGWAFGVGRNWAGAAFSSSAKIVKGAPAEDEVEAATADGDGANMAGEGESVGNAASGSRGLGVDSVAFGANGENVSPKLEVAEMDEGGAGDASSGICIGDRAGASSSSSSTDMSCCCCCCSSIKRAAILFIRI
jgi:hypothetical protein